MNLEFSYEMYSQIIRKIRIIRVDKGIKQREIARAIYVTPTAYNRMEKGRTQITVRNLVLIAKALKVDICELVRENSGKRQFPGIDDL
jgi:transcriptional regulator with XRE-family HTH domain